MKKTKDYIKDRVIDRILFYADRIIRYEKSGEWTFDKLTHIEHEAEGYIEGAYDTEILTFEEVQILEHYMWDVLFNDSAMTMTNIEFLRVYSEKIIIKYLV